MNSDKSSINYEGNDILNELKRSKNERDLKTFRKLLAHPPKTFNDTWTQVLLQLLNVIGDNEEGHIDQMRMASQAFFTIFAIWPSINTQEDYLKKILNLDNSPLYLFDNEIHIYDIELFKLNIIHGYLLVSNETLLLFNTFTTAFEIIRKYCMEYTKHIYFAFKLLNIWLKKSKEIKFWNKNDSEIEKKLEAIIFSNWDNCINEISTINSSHLFPVYLEIMEDKYDGFLEYALKTTNEHLSWQNPTKFIIITEICKVTHDYPNLPHLETNIFQSITKSHLKHVGTKLYITLLGNMNEEQWNESMRTHLFSCAEKWESEWNEKALHILWELWMKPTIKKFNDTTAIDEEMQVDNMFPRYDTNYSSFIPLLWHQFCNDGTMISASYLVKIASEIGVTWTKLNSHPKPSLHTNKQHYEVIEKYWSKCKITGVPRIIDVAEEYVKLNVFVAYCRMNDFLNENEDYELCKRFLYFNANSCSPQFRKVLLDNFKILFERVVKIRGDTEISFCQWLYYFIFDCFEPGSCYQRKIIGLRLYEIILMYTNAIVDEKRKRKRKNISDGVLMKEHMRNAEKWDMENKFSFSILLRMCLDPIAEIREQSFNIINNYFNVNVLTNEEIETLTLKAIEMNKSSKFYEIAGGVKLTLIVNKHEATLRHVQFYEILFERAQLSLQCIKQDIFKAFIEGSEFIASLSALFELEFQEALNNSYEHFLKKLLSLIEDATIVFLSALVPQASNVSYSSSFAEMAIAIDERIKSSEAFLKIYRYEIATAHQILISCIWMALKTLCDLTVKISILTNSYDNVKRSIDVVVSVLMKCRHKGAIESAGVALGVLVRHLADKQEYHCLIDACLDKLLNLNLNDKIDLTRRGAGLSIMFHRIISNDSKKSRRLLHMALGRLIESLSVSAKRSDIVGDTNQDCARARQLHFLRRIFVDKTLYPYLVPYMEKISMICFEHLQSLEWAIRNASLQLMGALIPRLVGQSLESELDFGNGYSVNHFFTHYPILAEFVLQRVNDPSAFNIDSNMVPIVTLISKMSVGGCDFIDYSSEKYTADLRTAMRSLFGHTVDHVRYAAAKAYAALVSIREIPQELLNMKMEKIGNKSRNFIHGHLMAQICLYLSAERAKIWLNTFSNQPHSVRMLEEGNQYQIERAWAMCDYWWKNADEYGKISLCYVIEATFLQSCRMTSFCSYNGHEIHDTLSNNAYKLLTRCNLSMQTAIGIFECLDQLFKLYNGKRYGGLPMAMYDFNLNAIYYSMKCVFTDVHMFHSKNLCTKHLFEFILTYLADYEVNDSFVIECFEILYLIVIYEINCCPECYHTKLRPSQLFQTCDPLETLLIFVEKYSKKKKLCALIYTVLVLYIEMMDIDFNDEEMMTEAWFKQTVHKFIARSIDNGDEQERIGLIELCTNDYIRAIKSLIALLSDENEEVRMALYKKMREWEWPNNLYYFNNNIINVRLYSNLRYWCHMNMELIPKNLQFYLHNAIHTLAVKYPAISLRENLKWMPNTVKGQTLFKYTLESPFDEDETHREITKLFNIYYYYRHNIRDSDWPRPLLPVDYNEIIKSGNNFLKNYITHLSDKRFTDLHSILHFKVADYLHYKAEIYEKEYSSGGKC